MNLPLREFSEIVAAMRPSNMSPSGSEKRVASRMEVSARIQSHLLEAGKVKRSYSVWARDISLTGMGVIQSVVLPHGAEVLLELPRTPGWTYVCGVVIRCGSIAEGLAAVGFEFTAMADGKLTASLAQMKTDEAARIQRSMMQ